MSTHKERRAKRSMIRAAAKISHLEFDSAPVEWIAAAEADAQSPKRFAMTAYTGGAMLVSAWGPPVVIDLVGMTAKAPVPILFNHDSTEIVGHADEVEVGDSTLKLAGVISGASEAAAQVEASAAKGFPWKASVGARPDKMEFVGEDVTTKVNGKTFKGPLYVARKSTLGEVSFVAMAADSKTSAKVAAAAANNKGFDMKFEQWIEALGLVVAELRDDQLAKLREKYDAEVKAAAKEQDIKAGLPKMDPPKFDLSAVVLHYEKHTTDIQGKISKYSGKIEAMKLAEIQANGSIAAIELKAKALNEEWAAVRFEAELIKAAAIVEAALIVNERPKGPAIHASTRDMEPQTIEAAFCLSAGLAKPETYFKPEVLEAAHRHHKGLGLQELLLLSAAQAGYSGRMRLGADNLRAVLKAAFSVHSLTTLITQAGNKFLLEGFAMAPQMWREVARTRSVSDFKQVTAFRMNAELEYKQLGPGGEIQHGTVSQESFTMQAKTYARMAAFTREDIINDDLGALDDLRRRLGVGAGMKLNNVIWTAWMAASDGGAFWTAARANLVTSSALAEAGLNTAVKAFRTMANPDGGLLGFEPDRIIIPADLEATGRKLYSSQEMRDTTASTKFMTSNIYFNRFRPVVVPELGISSFTGYSATTWYLATDPNRLASMVVSFLNGQESPTVESADVDFNQLGIQFRGYHDFGADMSEYRATVKATA